MSLDDAIRLGSEEGNPGNREGVRSIELSIPRRLLQSGLRLVDTPGVGGLDSAHGAATMNALVTGRSRAVRQRRIAAAHCSGAGVPRDRRRAMPERGAGHAEDRHPPVVAARRGDQPFVPERCRAGHRHLPDLVGAAPAGGGGELHGTQRGVGLHEARAAARRRSRGRRRPSDHPRHLERRAHRRRPAHRVVRTRTHRARGSGCDLGDGRRPRASS